MTKAVDLVSYLPPFLAEFKEIAASLEAENPEFVLLWNAAERVLQNEFIETADEYGVSRFEKMANILPSSEDTLESRRGRVQSKWLDTIPYTMRSLLVKLTGLCGEDNPPPTISDYTLRVPLPVSTDYLHILDDVCGYVPANMVIDPLILLSKIRMPHYTGAAFRCSIKQTITTEAWNTDNINLLADENGKVLMEEAGNRLLFEEVTGQ